MKWFEPIYGSERIRSAFLIFPKTIYGETRWLCKATWLEQYRSLNLFDLYPRGPVAWRANNWIGE